VVRRTASDAGKTNRTHTQSRTDAHTLKHTLTDLHTHTNAHTCTHTHSDPGFNPQQRRALHNLMYLPSIMSMVSCVDMCRAARFPI
jgi:hypothetical protein